MPARQEKMEKTKKTPTPEELRAGLDEMDRIMESFLETGDLPVPDTVEESAEAEPASEEPKSEEETVQEAEEPDEFNLTFEAPEPVVPETAEQEEPVLDVPDDKTENEPEPVQEEQVPETEASAKEPPVSSRVDRIIDYAKSCGETGEGPAEEGVDREKVRDLVEKLRSADMGAVILAPEAKPEEPEQPVMEEAAEKPEEPEQEWLKKLGEEVSEKLGTVSEKAKVASIQASASAQEAGRAVADWFNGYYADEYVYTNRLIGAIRNNWKLYTGCVAAGLLVGFVGNLLRPMGATWINMKNFGLLGYLGAFFVQYLIPNIKTFWTYFGEMLERAVQEESRKKAAVRVGIPIVRVLGTLLNSFFQAINQPVEFIFNGVMSVAERIRRPKEGESSEKLDLIPHLISAMIILVLLFAAVKK